MAARPRRAELLLLLGSVAFFLFVAEAAVRLLQADQAPPTGYAPVNTNRRFMRPKNSKGYRDLERTEAKPPGVRRGRPRQAEGGIPVPRPTTRALTKKASST